jgi:hypothetical protein
MKKIYAIIFIVALNLSAYAQWVNLGNQGFSTVEISHTSMTVDASGAPVVAYINDATRFGTVMQYMVGSNVWDTLGNANMTGGAADQIMMQTAANGDMYAAYVNSSSTGISVKKLVGATWTLVGASNFSGGLNIAGMEQYWDFAVSAAGVPYAIYFESSTGNPVVKSFNGTSWVNVGAIPAPNAVNGSANIEIDNGGVPVIAFQDDGGQTIKVLRYNGTSWVNAVAAGDITTPDALDMVRLKINPTDNRPYVVYREFTAANGGSGEANMKRGTAGGAWTNVGPADFNNAPYFAMSFVIDNTGAPLVAYPDGSSTGQNRPTVLRFSAGAWSPVGNALFTSNGVSLPSLVTDLSGNPYIVFQDWSAGDFSTAMKLASNPLSIYDFKLNGSADAGKNVLTCALDASVVDGTIVLERSEDGANFVALASTPITPEVVAAQYIKWNDMQMIASTSFYRAKYIDAAGQGSYTNTIVLGTVANEVANVYPTLANNLLYVQSREVGSISIFNQVGAQVMAADVSNIGTNSIDISQLPKGVYIVRINGNPSKTFVKQ